MSITTFYEDPDPMISTKLTYPSQSLYERWLEVLKDTKCWKWEKMQELLRDKKPEEVWYVVKSVDCIAGENMTAPFVPNFIIMKPKKEKMTEKGRAPRVSMRAAKRDDTMDPEGFLVDDIFDMKNAYHWVPLSGATNVYILCGVDDDLSPPVAFDFGNSAGGFLPSTNASGSGGSGGFDFGASSSSSSGFNFGGASGADTKATGFDFGTGVSSGGFNFGGNKEENKEKTEDKKEEKSGGFNFGGSSTASSGFNFGGSSDTSTATGFNFGGSSSGSGGGDEQKTSKKRKERDETDQHATQPPAKKFKTAEEAIFPVLWQKHTIEDIVEGLEEGMKVIAVYEKVDDATKEKFSQKLIVETDLEFAEFSEEKKLEVIKSCVQKKMLVKNEDFQKMKSDFEENFDHSAGESAYDAYDKKRQEFLLKDEIAKPVNEIMQKHSTSMLSLLNSIIEQRVARFKDIKEKLSAITHDLKEGSMYYREDYCVHRVFPETSSLPKEFTFRPCITINKSIGKADECSPPAYKLVNPLTGEVKIQ